MTTHPASVAAYLAGDLTTRDVAAVEEHLIDCDPCWREVQLARLGARTAASSAEACPPELRLRVAELMADASSREGRDAPRRRDRRRLLGLAASVVAAAAVGTGTFVASRPAPAPPLPVAASPVPSSAIDEAVDCYRKQMLPMATATSTPPTGPDLAPVGLTMTGATSASLGGQPVTALAYGARGGRSVFVFLSDSPLNGSAPGTVTTRVDGYAVFTDTEHPMVVVGSDAGLVREVAAALTRS